MEVIIKKYQAIFLLFVLLIAFFLRFYKLDEIPDGLYQDETAIGYNAYSINEIGKDEHGESYPLYFKSFGDRKLPVYIYLTSISQRIFGVNEFSVRFPSAFFGSITILVLYFFLLQLTRKYTVPFVSCLFLAITPWHLHFSRSGFEVNVALFFALLGALLLLLAKGKGRFVATLMVFSVLSFGASLYSYNVTRILSPLLACAIIFNYRHEFGKISKHVLILSAITAIIVTIPFISTILTSAGAQSAGGALITSKDVTAKNLEFRSYILEYPLFAKIFFNQWIGIIWVYLENLGKLFDARFFFVNGSSHGNQGIGTSGVFYVFQLPLFLAGLLLSVMKKKVIPTIFIWGILSALILALSKEVPHATRGYFLVLPITVYSAVGLIALFQYTQKMKFPFKAALLIFSTIFIGYNIIYYFTSYYIRFPIMYAANWRQQDKMLVAYLQNHGDKYDKIIVDNKADFIYTSYLFYSQFPPDEFLATVKRLPDDSEGFSKVISFGKVEYKDIDWNTDPSREKTLIITDSSQKPDNIESLATFYYPQRPVYLSVKEELFGFPVTDVAYILVEGKR